MKKNKQTKLKWNRHYLKHLNVVDIYQYVHELLVTFKSEIAYNNPTVVYVAYIEIHIGKSRPRNISQQFNISIQTNTEYLLNTLKAKLSFEIEKYYQSDINNFTMKYAEFEQINVDTPIIPIDKEVITKARIYNLETLLNIMPLNKPLYNLMTNNRYFNENVIILFNGVHNGWFRYKLIHTMLNLEFDFQQKCSGNIIETSFYYMIYKFELDGEYLFTNILYTPRFIKPIINPQDTEVVTGVFDIETYIDSDGSHKVYNIGLVKFNLDLENMIGLTPGQYITTSDKWTSVIKTYYLTSYTNDEALITDFITNLLTPGNNKKLYYAHNLMGFDLVFLLKYLNRIAKCDILERNGEIYSIDVRYGPDNKYVVYIRDSYKILPLSLKKLSKHFLNDVNVNDEITNLKYQYTINTKDIFPYSFITDVNNITYVGEVPEKSYFDSTVTQEDYDSYKKRFIKKKWNLKTESTKYMILDCILLFLILNKYNTLIYNKYKINPINNISISGLTYKIYLHNYIGENKIPILSGAVYQDIRESYYGGVCEVYKPYGENLYYYDVNSLYPYAMLNDMPGGLFYKSNNSNLDSYFGFVKAAITTPKNMYMPYLVLKHDHRLYLPEGYWTGWYFSEELKYARELGYEISIIEGYNFKRIRPFNDMITELYELKRTSDIVMRTISKLLLNNLYGRFGMKDDNTITRIVSSEDYHNILKNNVITSDIEIDDGVHMVTYYVNYISDKITKGEWIEPNINIAIASAITGYSRIYMDQIKRKYERNVYYTDTDSLVLDVEIDSSLINDNIGKFKKEHNIVKGLFPSYKMYGLIDDKGNTIIKAKGLDSKSLTYDDLYKYYTTSELSTSIVKKHKSFKDHTIYEIDTEMKILDLANKRAKIIDNNKWVGTKPLIYDGNSKTLI